MPYPSPDSFFKRAFFCPIPKFCSLLSLFSQTSFTLFSCSFSSCAISFFFSCLLFAILFLRSIIIVVLHFVMPLVYRTILDVHVALDEPPVN
ncbi:hypothetical protein V6Z12_D12G051900 [Gossypium hirsutum]